MSGRRQERLAEQIREEVSMIIAGEVEDPRVATVTVTDARLTPDLRNAKIYVTVLGSDAEIDEALAALKHAAGFIRTQLGAVLRIRRTPELHFVYGNAAEVVLHDRVPPAYHILPGSDRVLVQSDIDTSYDAAFIIECSDVDRPGLPGLHREFVVNIDHHSTTLPFGDINWIDPTAAAVGEMLYNLCKALGVEVSNEIADCIYTALLTDTA